MLKKRKTFQKYKNVILWSVSALVISLILLDLFGKLEGLPGANTQAIGDDYSNIVFVMALVHLIVSVLLAIPFTYDLVCKIVPTANYKNQILWGVSLVVCVVMVLSAFDVIPENFKQDD